MDNYFCYFSTKRYLNGPFIRDDSFEDQKHTLKPTVKENISNSGRIAIQWSHIKH